MNKDTISRCELFNRLATLPAPAEANSFKAEVYKIIQKMETEDRPQGEWIDIEPRLNRRRVNKYKQCSRCGFSWARPFDDNYCPNCGARMKGADDDSDNI